MSIISFLISNPVTGILMPLFVVISALGAYKFVKEFLPW